MRAAPANPALLAQIEAAPTHINAGGYVMVRVGRRNHPAHRLIWEAWHGRSIPSGHVVHHKNHDRQDNRIRNLRLMSAKDHTALHRETALGIRVWKQLVVVIDNCQKAMRAGKCKHCNNDRQQRSQYCLACCEESYRKPHVPYEQWRRERQKLQLVWAREIGLPLGIWQTAASFARDKGPINAARLLAMFGIYFSARTMKWIAARERTPSTPLPSTSGGER